MPSAFTQIADELEDLSAIFVPGKENGRTLSAGQVRAVLAALTKNAERARLADRQRDALVKLLGRPVEEKGVAIMLLPFDTIDGGRA